MDAFDFGGMENTPEKLRSRLRELAKVVEALNEEAETTSAESEDWKDKTIANLKEHLAKELMYRQALERQLANANVRQSVEDSELRYRLAKEEAMEKLRLELAKKDEELMKRPEQEKQAQLMAEISHLEKENGERVAEVAGLRQRLSEVEEALEESRHAIQVMKTGMAHLENERKTLRAQVARLKQTAPVAVSASGQASASGGDILLAYQEQLELLSRETEDLRRQMRLQAEHSTKLLHNMREDLLKEHTLRLEMRRRFLAGEMTEEDVKSPIVSPNDRLLQMQNEIAVGISALPDEILGKIISYMGALELVMSVQFVNKRWQRLAWVAFTNQVLRFRRAGLPQKGILERMRSWFVLKK